MHRWVTVTVPLFKPSSSIMGNIRLSKFGFTRIAKIGVLPSRTTLKIGKYPTRSRRSTAWGKASTVVLKIFSFNSLPAKYIHAMHGVTYIFRAIDCCPTGFRRSANDRFQHSRSLRKDIHYRAAQEGSFPSRIPHREYCRIICYQMFDQLNAIGVLRWQVERRVSFAGSNR